MPLSNKLKGTRLIGFLSILCSVFVAILGWLCIVGLVFSLDYGPDAMNALPPVQGICSLAVGLLIAGTLIGTYISVLLLLIGGFIILWKPNWQGAARIGVYVSLASGIGMILAFFLSAPIRMAINLSAFEAFLAAALLSIFPLIYMAFPVILLILFRKARAKEEERLQVTRP